MADIAVSLVIIHYNNFDCLAACLRSIVKFCDLPEAGREIIIVDNGSSDGAPQWAEKEYGIRVVRSETNLGFARAANLGIRNSSGGLVAIVNNDVEFTRRTSIRAMAGVFERRPDAGLVCCQLLNSDLSDQASFFFFPGLATELINKSLLRRAGAARGRAQSGEREVQAAFGAFMLISRAALDDAGMFDEDFFFFMEETDLCLRFKRKGWKVVFTPDSAMIHHQGKTADRTPLRARVEFYISRYIFFRKHGGRAANLLLRAGLFLRLLVNSLSYIALNVFSLFLVPRYRSKLASYLGLVGWHLAGCPRSMGLGALNAAADGKGKER